MSKRKAVEIENELNPPLANLVDLNEIYSILGKLNDPNIDQNGNEIINKIRDNIPRIVFLGDQSTGKSTLLQKMYEIKVVCKRGIGTKVPTKFILSPQHRDEQCWLLDENGNIAFHCEYEKIDELYNFIDSKTNEIKFGCSIIVELKSKINLMIVDLPGIIQNLEENFVQNLIHHYLMGDQTIIVNVCQPIVDMETVRTLQILERCDPKSERTIHVLTYLDQVMSDTSFVKCLEEYLNKLPGKKFLTINANNEKIINEKKEMEELKKIMKNQYSNVEYGTKNLKNYLSKEICDKLEKITPIIRGPMCELKIRIRKLLNEYGRKKQSSDELKRNFIRKFRENLDKEFSQAGSNFRIKINELREECSEKNLQKYLNCINLDINTIVDEIKLYTGIELPGSGGWNEINRKYIGTLINHIKNNLDNFIQKIEKIFLYSINYIFESKKYNDIALTICSKQLMEAEEELSKKVEKYKKKIIKDLENTGKMPYVSRIHYERELFVSNHKDICLKLLAKIIEEKPKINNTKEGKEEYIDQFLYSETKIDEKCIYKNQARVAISNIEAFWMAYTKTLHENLCSSISQYIECPLLDYLKEIPDKLSDDDFSEPNEIDRRRQILLNAENMINNYLKTI